METPTEETIMRIWEQVDAGRERPIYSWMVQRSYATRGEMERCGWKWIPGRPRGVFVTNDPAAVARFRRLVANCNAEQVPPTVETNGSHARLGAAMHTF